MPDAYFFFSFLRSSLIPPSKKRCKELGGYSFTIGYSSDGTCQFAESNSIGIDGTCENFEVCISKEYPECIGRFYFHEEVVTYDPI